MKLFKLILASLLLVFSFAACSPEGRSEVDKSSQQIVVVISPSLPDRANSLATITTWLMHQANANVRIFDGGDATRITEFTVPQVKYFKVGAVADRIGQPLQKLVSWKQDTAGDARLLGTGALAIPELLERITQNRPAPTCLILVGSPVYRSPDNRDHDFSEPHLRSPSLGHLTDPKCPFSCVGKERSLAGVRVLFLFPKDVAAQWPVKYEETLRKFYGALFAKRGGALLSFTPDLAAGLQAMNDQARSPLDELPGTHEFTAVQWVDAQPSAAKSPTLANSATSQLTQAISRPVSSSPLASTIDENFDSPIRTNSTRNVPRAEPAVRSSAELAKPDTSASPARPSLVVTTAPPRLVAQLAPTSMPTSVSVSSTRREPQKASIPQARPGVTIVLRYKADGAAADLYMRPHAETDEISFRQPSTFLGTHHYQFDFDSGEHVKSIHLPGGCDPAKAQIWVNYASGFGRLAGKIIWLTPEGQSEVPFSFVALKGGDPDHKRESSRRKSEFWQRINPFDFTVTKPSGRPSVSRPTSSVSRSSSGQPNMNENPTK